MSNGSDKMSPFHFLIQFFTPFVLYSPSIAFPVVNIIAVIVVVVNVMGLSKALLPFI